jgi:hypothetical protein
MHPRYSIVAVHGINGASGKTEAGFSKELANLVMPDKAWQDEFWHEAIWEGACDDLDDTIKKIVAELINSYDFEEYFGKLMNNRKGAAKVLPMLGLFASSFAKWVVPDFVGAILDYAIDLPLYLGNAYGHQMRNMVEKKIRRAAKRAGGVVVVGHSLGSVIAHDAVAKLLKCSTPPAVKALVTMGSPLDWVVALRETQKGNGKNLQVPRSLKWLNFYNTVDPVTLKRGLSEKDFPGAENVLIGVKSKRPLLAHSAYWSDKTVAEQIRHLVFPQEGSFSNDGSSK